MNPTTQVDVPHYDPSLLRWLRIVVWVDAVVLVLVWGLPSLVGTVFFAFSWGLTLPSELIYVRLLGMVSVAWGLLLFLTLARLMRNIDVLRITVLLHIFVAGTIIFGFVTSGVTGLFALPNAKNTFWVVAFVINALLAVGLGLTLPHPLHADAVGKTESAVGWKNPSRGPRREKADK